MRLKTHMSDLKRNHSSQLVEWEHRVAQVASERDGLFVQIKEQAAGMISVREELRDYEAECAKLRRVLAGAGGLRLAESLLEINFRSRQIRAQHRK